MAENHHEFTPYNYVLGNPAKYADFMGLDTISKNDNVTPVKANDVRQTDNGDYTTASQGDLVINIPNGANKNQGDDYLGTIVRLAQDWMCRAWRLVFLAINEVLVVMIGVLGEGFLGIIR